MPFSVYREGAYWDVVVSRPTNPIPPLVPVWLYRDGNRCLLGQLFNRDRFGWTIVVAGEVTGPRLVDGFKTRWQAIEYAIKIRPDCNPETRDWSQPNSIPTET